MGNSLRILFDHGIFCRQTYGGSSKYYVHLARKLSVTPSIQVVVRGLFNHNSYLQGYELPKVAWHIPHFRGENKVVPTLNELLYGTMPLNTYDIVHETYPVRRRPRLRSPGVVITIHDMIHEKFPSLFPGSAIPKLKREAAARAETILTISENSRTDILDIYNINPRKVKVVHLGVELKVRSQPECNHSSTTTPFLLFVGRRNKYKDFSVLLRAMSISSNRASGLDLIAFGGGPPTTCELDEIGAFNLDNRVTFQSGSDERLAQLYESAVAFVFPSRYEGFGLPLLEAMASRCPVICSDASCFPEVAGEAAWFFEAGSAEALVEAIHDVTSSPTEVNRRVEAGLSRAAHFSWDRCATETLKAYKALVG